MHEYVKEWWESKVFKGHEKSEENLKKFEDHFGSRDTFSKRMEERDNLKDGQNFAFILPKVGRKKSLQMINFIAEQTKLNKERGDGHIIKNLWVPEIVNVDYSEYVDEPMYKGALFAKHYKDGILIVNHPLKGNEGCAFFEIAGVEMKIQLPQVKVFLIYLRNHFLIMVK